MYLETFEDYLAFYGMSEKDACKLLGKSLRTIKRWNDSPPDYAIRIIKLFSNKPPFPDCWENWYFDGEYLCDPASNKYHQTDINALFFERQLIREIRGDKYQIASLKQELERKKELLKTDILISVDVGNIKQKFKIAL